MINETRRTFGSKINGTKWKTVGKTISFVFTLLALAILLGLKLGKISDPFLLTVAIVIVGLDTLVEFFGLIKL